MLKRPQEKSWNWRQPPDPFPPCPGCSGAFVAKTASGKTTTLISMVIGPYRKVFDAIYVVSPSVNIDSAWDPVKDFAKGLKSAEFLEDFDEARILEILDEQRQKIHELKLAKSKKPLPQCLFILDDVSDRPEILHSQRAGSILSTMFTRGRHIGINCWLSV